MKWYNKDNTKMIDLDKVASFDYNFNFDPKTGSSARSLILNIAGQLQVLSNNDAREVYNKLTSQLKVLE